MQIGKNSTAPQGESAFASNLRAAVLGINDGLVSNFSILMGVIGGTDNAGVVVLAGVASLVAGALSMAAGEFISVRSQRERLLQVIATERALIRADTARAKQLVENIYIVKGLPRADAHAVAERLASDNDLLLETIVLDKHGVAVYDASSAWSAALYSMSAFAAGGIIPLLPFLVAFSTSAWVIWLAVGLSGLAFIVVGAGIARMSGINLTYGALRMLFIGVFAAAVTYGIGSIIGVML